MHVLFSQSSCCLHRADKEKEKGVGGMLGTAVLGEGGELYGETRVCCGDLQGLGSWGSM